MAKPTKLNAEVTAKIVELVRAGDAPEVAAGVHGIGRSTFFEWMQAGLTEPEGGRHREFRTAIACARDHFESAARATVLDGDDAGIGFGRAKAALEVLSRRVPARWSQRVKHEIDESNRLMFEVLQRVCADEAVNARVRAEGNLSAVVVSVCAELSRLDGEADSSEDHEPASPIH